EFDPARHKRAEIQLAGLREFDETWEIAEDLRTADDRTLDPLAGEDGTERGQRERVTDRGHADERDGALDARHLVPLAHQPRAPPPLRWGARTGALCGLSPRARSGSTSR